MINKYKGCLLGLAIGDALGAPIKFLRLPEIKVKYGEDGITEFDAWDRFRPGFYTDDTQMSLATTVGCIKIFQRFMYKRSCNSTDVVYARYLEWLESQANQYQMRFPGNTCLNALKSGKMGTIESPINYSKECGGLLRTAAAGLAFPPEMAFREGAEYAAITHGHPSGYLPAGFLSKAIAHILEGKSLQEAVELGIRRLIKYEGHEETLKKIMLAVELSFSLESVENSIKEIGEGVGGDEALAIGLYCSLKYFYDFRKGVQAAANHSGESDTTGMIAGAILGALLGDEDIPESWILKLENAPAINQLADDSFAIFKGHRSLPLERYPLN